MWKSFAEDANIFPNRYSQNNLKITDVQYNKTSFLKEVLLFQEQTVESLGFF